MTGEEIRRARKERRWTQAQLAKAAGTTQSVISELESGDRIPNVATLERIAGALGLELRIRFIDPNAPRAVSIGSTSAEVAALLAS